MAFKDVLFRILRDLFVERPARKTNLKDLSDKLSASGLALSTRYGGVANRDANREALRHIIGIERWAQHRLRMFLGESNARDEYEGYRPPDSYSWNDLRDDFNQTRTETVALAGQLLQHSVAENATVPHNDFGPLTAKGWLQYLLNHAERESLRIK